MMPCRRSGISVVDLAKVIRKRINGIFSKIHYEAPTIKFAIDTHP